MHPCWRVLTGLVNTGSNLQQHILEEVYTRSDTHAHMASGTELCMPAILSNVLIQHDKTSVIYELIERNAFWCRSPSIMSRLHTVKHITVHLSPLFSARIMWLLCKEWSIKNTFYLQDNRCEPHEAQILMKSWLVNASCFGIFCCSYLFFINNNIFIVRSEI